MIDDYFGFHTQWQARNEADRGECVVTANGSGGAKSDQQAIRSDGW